MSRLCGFSQSIFRLTLITQTETHISLLWFIHFLPGLINHKHSENDIRAHCTMGIVWNSFDVSIKNELVFTRLSQFIHTCVHVQHSLLFNLREGRRVGRREERIGLFVVERKSIFLICLCKRSQTYASMTFLSAADRRENFVIFISPFWQLIAAPFRIDSFGNRNVFGNDFNYSMKCLPNEYEERTESRKCYWQQLFCRFRAVQHVRRVHAAWTIPNIDQTTYEQEMLLFVRWHGSGMNYEKYGIVIIVICGARVRRQPPARVEKWHSEIR